MRASFLRGAGKGLLLLMAGGGALGCGDDAASPDAPVAPGGPVGAIAPVATSTNPPGASPAPTAPVTSTPVTGGTGTAPSATGGMAAGNAATPATPATNSADAWCKAKAVLDARCVACHDGKGTAGTPMGLASYTDLSAAAPGKTNKKVWERVGVRIHADKAGAEGLGAMPPKNDMSAAQIADLDAWLAAGAPGSDTATCAPSANAGSGSKSGRPASIWDPTLCDAIYKLTVNDGAGGKLKIPAGPEETYPKVDVDAPWGDETVQIINQRPITDNKAVLHHWILYDKAGPFITGWAPGDEERQPLPESVGMKVPSGRASMYLDVHYYNRTGQAQEDASGVEVCIVKGKNLRPNPAGITMGFSQIVFSIPPAAKNYSVRGECTIRANQPIHLMSASPHAHKLARRMVFTAVKKSGGTINMLDAPFLFGEQASYPLEKEIILESGDKVITECLMSNDSSREVTFGESNDTEMCFNFASYYPVGGFCCEEIGLESCLFGGPGGASDAGGLIGGILGGFLGGN